MRIKNTAFGIVLLLSLLLAACENHNNDDAIQSLIAANDAIVKTDKSMILMMGSSYHYFDELYISHPEIAKSLNEKARQIKMESAALIAFIENVKWEVVALVENKTIDEIRILEKKCKNENSSFLSKLSGNDNVKTPDHYFFENGGIRMTSIEEKIQKYKDRILEILGSDFSKQLKFDIDLRKSAFLNSNLANDVVLLNSNIVEIRNAEYDAISLLSTTVNDDEGVPTTREEAIVVAKKTHLSPGEKFEAEIFVGFYDSKQHPKITIGSSVNPKTLEVMGPKTFIQGEKGFGTYSIVANGVGEHTFGGVIEVVSRNGETTKYPFNSSYFVEEPK